MIETLPKLTLRQTDILKTVLYFDVFRYPLTIAEIRENVPCAISREELENETNLLISCGLLRKEQGFVMAPGRNGSDIEKRRAGNKGAEQIMPVAFEYSRKIASFPFVEGVCLSGGLSKNYYDENSDIDFFIITRPDRLWLCRTLLILRYKLLPESRKRFWCTNYFITSDDLVIPDENPFTATELAHLIPTINYGLYKKLLACNSWYKKKFPNKDLRTADGCSEPRASVLKTLTEGMLSGFAGRFLDKVFLEATHRRWKNKFPELSEADFNLQFRSQKNVCKRHTKGFQNKVLLRWAENQKEFGRQFNIHLD